MTQALVAWMEAQALAYRRKRGFGNDLSL